MGQRQPMRPVGTVAVWDEMRSHIEGKRCLSQEQATESSQPMAKAVWVDRFVMKMSRLGVRAEPDMIGGMAEELFETLNHLDPEAAAQAEWDEWPPHDD